MAAKWAEGKPFETGDVTSSSKSNNMENICVKSYIKFKKSDL
jgi:hypothetical protein